MGVTYPLALLLGAGLVALPTLIHFLARSRPVRVRYPTVRFLREALKHRKALFRFRDIVVLILRAIAVVLLAAAFARLFTRSNSAIALEGDMPTVRVVLLDASQSMEARKSVVQVFDRAKAAARKYIRRRAGLKADVVVCTARAVPLFERISDNFTGLEAALSSVAPRSEALDVRDALAEAARLFQETRDEAAESRELIIISDFQLTSWSKAPFELIPAGVTIRFDQVGLVGDVGNLAVLDVRPANQPQPGEPLQLAVGIGNFSDVRQAVEVVVRVGDANFQAKTECAPWRSGQAVVSLPDNVTGANGQPGAGWLCGSAAIVDARDVLPADDERPFALELATSKHLVIVTREGPAEVGTSKYYLERALGCDERTRMLDPAHLDADILAQADLVIVVSAGRLSSDAVRLLSAFATRGAPLFFVAENTRDAENLAAFEAAAKDQLRLPVVFSGEWPRSGQPRRLAEMRTGQRPFKMVAASLDLVRSIEFAGGLGTVKRAGGTPEEVLATYDDGSAALIVSSCGRGSVAVLNADISRSTLRASPLFVPLVNELAVQLTREGADPSSCVSVGEPLQVFLPASTALASETQIAGPPAAGKDCGGIEDTQAGVFWFWRAVEWPGIYTVTQNKRIVHAVAAACPGSEGDLRLSDPEALKTIVSEGSRVEVERLSTDAPDIQQRREWWPWLMLSAVLCLMAELGLLKAFRS